MNGRRHLALAAVALRSGLFDCPSVVFAARPVDAPASVDNIRNVVSDRVAPTVAGPSGEGLQGRHGHALPLPVRLESDVLLDDPREHVGVGCPNGGCKTSAIHDATTGGAEGIDVSDDDFSARLPHRLGVPADGDRVAHAAAGIRTRVNVGIDPMLDERVHREEVWVLFSDSDGADERRVDFHERINRISRIAFLEAA